MSKSLTAPIAAVLLLVIAGFHVYWAAGGCWPGRDEQSLARTVVGIGPMPGAAACIGIAVLLVASAGLVLAASGAIVVPQAAYSLVRLGVYVVIAVLLLRGAFGFFETSVHSAVRGTPYAHWNFVLYSPLCVALAALAALSVKRT